MIRHNALTRIPTFLTASPPWTLKNWQILSLSTILPHLIHFVPRASSRKMCPASACIYDGINCVERHKRLSSWRALSALVLSNLPKRVSLFCVIQFANTFIGNYIPDETSTACAPYFKLYEKPALMNLNCHICLFSSAPSGTTRRIEKHWKKIRVSRFCFLTFSSSKNTNCES